MCQSFSITAIAAKCFTVKLSGAYFFSISMCSRSLSENFVDVLVYQPLSRRFVLYDRGAAAALAFGRHCYPVQPSARGNAQLSAAALQIPAQQQVSLYRVGGKLGG